MRTLLLGLLPACFSPKPPTGVPCETDADCPSPQRCAPTTLTCELEIPPGDGPLGSDAADAPPDSKTDCWAAWKSGTPTLGPPVHAAKISTNLREQDPTFTDDALGLYFARGDVIFFATRPDRTAELDNAVEVVELDSGKGETRLTEALDGTLAIFESRRDNGAGGADLWVTTRSAGGSFGTPTQTGLANINTTNSEFDPELTADGLHLYWSAPAAALGPRMIFTSSRDGVDKPFGDAVPVAFDSAAQVEASDPALSPDELVMIYVKPTPNSNVPDIHFATRTSTSQPFTEHGKLAALDSMAGNGDPDFSSDGCTVVFGSDRGGGAGSRDLYLSEVQVP